MIETKFETKRFLKKYSIQLLNNRVNILKTTPFDSAEFEIGYENIEPKKIVETKMSYGLLLLIIFLSIVGIMFLFGDNASNSISFFILAFVFFCIASITKLKIITIKSYEGINIELYFTNRNKEDVLNFADTIISSANSYILNKFSKIDRDLPIENQLANISYLRNKDLITEEKFEELKNQLLGRENKKSIGYK